MLHKVEVMLRTLGVRICSVRESRKKKEISYSINATYLSTIHLKFLNGWAEGNAIWLSFCSR